MEVIMQEQNKRAVESMCRCGLNLEGVIKVFPNLPRDEITTIYESVKELDINSGRKSSIGINCS